jgi:hypothetical protein
MSKSRQIELTAESRKVTEDAPGSPSKETTPARSNALVLLPVQDKVRSVPRFRPWAWWAGLAISGSLAAWLYYAQPWMDGVEVVTVEVVALAPVTRVCPSSEHLAQMAA